MENLFVSFKENIADKRSERYQELESIFKFIVRELAETNYEIHLDQWKINKKIGDYKSTIANSLRLSLLKEKSLVKIHTRTLEFFRIFSDLRYTLDHMVSVLRYLQRRIRNFKIDYTTTQ